MKRSFIWLAPNFVLSLLVCFAMGQTPPRVLTQAQNDALQKLIDRLNSPDVADRDRAELAIEKLAGFYVSAVQEQAKRTDLSPTASVALNKALKRLEPRARWLQKRKERNWIVGDEMSQLVLADVKRHARKQDTWLDDVQKLIDLAARESHAQTAKEQRALRDQERDQFDVVLKAGCKEPALLALYGLFSFDAGDSADKVYSIFKQARQQSDELDVSPYITFVINRRILNGMAEGRDGGPPAQNHAANQIVMDTVHSLCRVLEDPKIPFQVKISGSESLLDTAKQVRLNNKSLYEKVFAGLEPQYPNDPQVLCLKGRCYKEIAWEARGGDVAQNVTPQGWKGFADGLETAAKALNTSYDLDPSDPAAATEMITVVMGQNLDASEMEKWFQRAMDADPDNIAACRAKMYYLEPKWHGSPEEMLKFGRQLFEDGDWFNPEIPLMLVGAHRSLSAYDPAPDQYYLRPGVWDDLYTSYSKALDMNPDAAGTRSIYCRYACRCHQWKEANAQFKILGDRVVHSAFASEQELDEFKRKAAESADNP